MESFSNLMSKKQFVMKPNNKTTTQFFPSVAKPKKDPSSVLYLRNSNPTSPFEKSKLPLQGHNIQEIPV